ncbi:hypothetical protein Cni_G03833 [Canna indica]|uniref:NHL repeat-containing protein n=1 Tax=Canna indica TaxID=4628 RepID=A0AAQ3JUR3_9LILI|nr:hypothetical protein Cni_G03833 [Canna indica]
MEKKKVLLLLLFLVVLFGGFCCVSAASPARLASRFFSNLLSAILRRLWSLTPTTKNSILHRSSVRFESGYHVETVFDGSKLGIEPSSVEITPSGELVVLDSENSNIYRVSLPLSKYSRPKLVAGSAAGYTGHVDGMPREARMNHPTGITVDDKGNIYVADTKNKAIRKITETGVTTIAGGKLNKGAHSDGPSGDAKFSNDFEVVYISSSCSLLVVDRGNQAIREIPLHFDDCAYQYGAGITLGIAVLFAAAFFGYMLAMLQRRWAVVASSINDPTPTKASYISSPYQHPIKSSIRPPLIPPEAEIDRKEEEGLFTSTKKLIAGAGSSFSAIFSGIFSRKKPQSHHHNHHQRYEVNTWPSQESFMVPNEESPPVETQTPKPRKTYAFMSKNPEKLQQLRHSRAYFSGWEGEPQPQQHMQKLLRYSSGPQTYYEPSYETRGEVVFGAVQESDSKYERMEIEAVNYGDPFYDQYGPRHRANYMGCHNDY